MEVDKKYKKLGINTILVLIGGTGAKLIGFAMLPLYTRWLTVEDYGLADLITVYSTLLIGVIACCIYDAVFVLPKGEDIDNQKSYFTTSLFFLSASSVITAFIFYAFAEISKHFNLESVFFSYIWQIYALIIAEIFFKTTQQFCRCINKMILFSLSGVMLTAFTAVFAFVFIPSYGVKGYVGAMVLSYNVSSLVTLILSKSYIYVSWNHLNIHKLREMLSYSTPLIPNAIMWWIVEALNRPLMEKYVGLAGIGTYAIASKFPGLLSIINSSFNTSWQISVMEEFGKEDYKDFYNVIFKIIFILLSFVLVLVTLASRWLVEILTTPDFYGAWKFIPLLTLGVLFSNIGGLVGSNFSASKESKYYFYSSLWATVTALWLNIILIPILGIWGAAISGLCSFVAISVSRIIYSWKYVQIDNISYYLLVLLTDFVLMVLLINEVNSFVIILDLVVLLYLHLKGINSIVISNLKKLWNHH